MKILLLILLSLAVMPLASAHPVNMDVLAEIESSNNPKAYNKRTGASGTFQITPICLKHYNQEHKQFTDFTMDDMFRPEANKIVAFWYLNWLDERCDTVDEILIAYNWGYGNLRKYRAGKKKLPKETRDYLKKYHNKIKALRG